MDGIFRNEEKLSGDSSMEVLEDCFIAFGKELKKASIYIFLKLPTDVQEKKLNYTVIHCLEEFFDDEEVAPAGVVPFEELSLLLKCCVESLRAGSEMDQKYIRQLSCIISLLGVQGHPVSSAIFGHCAEGLLNLALHESIREVERDIVLTAVSAMCLHADFFNIADTFGSLTKHLDVLAKKLASFSTEAQLSAYIIILNACLWSNEKAGKMASWFKEDFCSKSGNGDSGRHFAEAILELQGRKLPYFEENSDTNKCTSIFGDQSSYKDFWQLSSISHIPQTNVKEALGDLSTDSSKKNFADKTERRAKSLQRFLQEQKIKNEGAALAIDTKKNFFNYFLRQQKVKGIAGSSQKPSRPFYVSQSGEVKFHNLNVQHPSANNRWPSFKRFKQGLHVKATENRWEQCLKAHERRSKMAQDSESD